MDLRVFLLDDHEVVRAGLRSLLEATTASRWWARRRRPRRRPRRIPPTRPDVAILDVRLPDGSGVEVCREIRSQHPEIACLMLTSYADDEALFASIMAGAAGYVLKQVGGNDLVDVVRTGGGRASPCSTRPSPSGCSTASRGPDRGPAPGLLTPQERRILELIAEGNTNRQIAEAMFLAEKTVKNYVSNLLAKLGMERRTQAASFAARLDERAAFEAGHDARGT